MKAEDLRDRLRMIYTDSMIERILVLSSLEGEIEKIIIDVHELSCQEAKQFINNVINISFGSFTVEVIHGYRHGTKIKDMLRKKFLNPYIKLIIPDQVNLGVTYLQPATAI